MTATPEVIAAALEQVELGFAVFALGHDSKVPVTGHGFKNATRKPEWVRTQLEQKGAGNYGMIWPADEPPVVVFDLDDGGGAERSWQDRLTDLMARLGPLPRTKATTTPSDGRHAFYAWPPDVPILPGDELFGFTVRWPGRGYVVGPGCSIGGRAYVAGPVHDIAPFPAAWVEAAVSEHARRGGAPGVITITGDGFVLPERIPSGRRYATVRDYVASRYNAGLGADELWALVLAEVAPRFEVAKPEAELRRDFERVIARIGERLGPPRKGMRAEDAVAAVSPIAVQRLSDIAVEAIVWLWHRYLPIGSITLFDGNPGEGKSTVVADLIARVTRGAAWPDGSALGEPGTVLYVTKEDDPATQVRPRIEAAGGDVGRVLFVATDLLFPRDLPRFRDLLEQVRPRLVLLDPLMSYLEGKVRVISDNEVRAALMTPLAELAREVGCALLVIRHFNKGTGQSALNRGAGSLGGLAGSARMVLALAPDPEDDDERARVFGVVKSNYEAKPPSLRVLIESAPVEGFTMTVSRASWQGASETPVGDLMERTREQHQAVLEAEEALRDILGKGALPRQQVFDAMKARGHSRSSTYAASKAIHVAQERVGFPSRTVWGLPLTVVRQSSENLMTGGRLDETQSSAVVRDEYDWRTTGAEDALGIPDEPAGPAPRGSRAPARTRGGRSRTSTTDDERGRLDGEDAVVPLVLVPVSRAPAREGWCRDLAGHAFSHHDVLTEAPWCAICRPPEEATP